MTDDKKKVGFAIMDRSKVQEIARKGGKAAHVAGTAHEFTREEAREAGRRGGKAVHAKRQAAKASAAASGGGPAGEKERVDGQVEGRTEE
jgi:general stress protein YciG